MKRKEGRKSICMEKKGGPIAIYMHTCPTHIIEAQNPI